MPRTEREALLRAFQRPIEEILSCVDSLRGDEIDRKIPEQTGNSVINIAAHVIANAEENVIERLGGTDVHRVRTEEFETKASTGDPLRDRWNELLPKIAQVIADLPADALEQEIDHPNRGLITGREVLLVVVRHANEHLGEAQVVRDLLITEREAKQSAS